MERIPPVREREPAPILARLVSSGRARPARRPGYRPRMRRIDGTETLSEALAEDRAEDQG